MQSGTSLPDRAYYLTDDEKSVSARRALVAYVTRLFELVQAEGAADIAASIVELETKLAEAQWSRTELRDAEKRYNKFKVTELAEKLGPEFSWPVFLNALGRSDVAEVNVMTPSFFESFDKVFSETDETVWRQYLEYKLLDAYAPVLSEDFVNAHFELYSKDCLLYTSDAADE